MRDMIRGWGKREQKSGRKCKKWKNENREREKWGRIDGERSWVEKQGSKKGE